MKRLILVLILPLAAAAPASDPLVVRASAVAAPCVAAAVPLFERTSGRRVALQTAVLGRGDSAAASDVVVGVEEELTRVIEGGASQPDVEADLATIPWVFVGSGEDTPTLHALERTDTRVRVLGGAIGRHARRSLERIPPGRVRSVREVPDVSSIERGELALVPLSLAGAGRTTAAEGVPPLLVRAVGVAASRQPESVRAFVAFLATGTGNAAFRSCGRNADR